MKKNESVLSRRDYIITLVGAVATAVLIYLGSSPVFIKPLYSGEAIFYVPLTIPSKQIEQQGIGFASDREIDGHIQIMKSGILRDSLIEAFELDKVYKIDLDNPSGLSRIYKIIDNRLQIEKTRYNSVSVVFRDTDPERAAEITNAVITLGDDIKEALLLANRRDALDYARILYQEKEAEIRKMELQLDTLGSAESDGESTLQEKLETLYAIEVQELAGRKNHLEREQKSFETELPRVYLLSKATPDYDQVYPRRGLLALAGLVLFSACFFIYKIIKKDASGKEVA